MCARVITLVGGWGMSAESGYRMLQEHFPKGICHYICPTPDFEERIPCNTDFLLGHSLGGRLIARSQRCANVPQVCLLAPAFSIVKEDEMGGIIRFRMLDLMIRRFQENPFRELAVFREFIGLKAEKAEDLPYDYDSLLWGLMCLQKVVHRWEMRNSWGILLGEKDPLINAQQFKSYFPGNTKLIQECSHDLSQLLESL